MSFELAAFLPPGLDQGTVLALVAISFVTSLITATFSLGGGTLMLAALAVIFPPAVVVPVHGAVQLGSNAGRALVQRAHIQWPAVVWIALGAVVGTLVGGQFAAFLPEQAFQVAIASFILITTWLPQPKRVESSRVGQFVGGALVSALGMVVGAVGPLVAVFLRGIPDRRQLVASHAALMTLQNGSKIAVFWALGFAFAAYLPLVLAMIGSGFIGTALGSRLLLKVPEKLFRYGFKLVLSLVSLDILRNALT